MQNNKKINTNDFKIIQTETILEKKNYVNTYNNKIYVVGNFNRIRMPTGYGSNTSLMTRRTSFAVFDLSGNLLPEALHFTRFDGDYIGVGGYDVNTLFITGSTGYFGGNFESVVGNGPESNLPISTSICIYIHIYTYRYCKINLYMYIYIYIYLYEYS